ncbi:inverse autotransporter beta domain-containing protein [Pantoea sp. B65]|uniref:inverse autotransporter beta domain-containing protein n=1 Tax=Pantoea sp. B65 TaxID=2813359 RepID=UPI0039B6E5E6
MMTAHNTFRKQQQNPHKGLALIQWILLLIIIISLPASSRAADAAEKKTARATQDKHYVLMPKPQDNSWQALQHDLALEIADLADWQQQMARRYDLQLNEWLLLPDVNATTHLYPAVDLVQIAKTEEVQSFAWRYKLSVSQLVNLNQPVKTAAQLADLRGQWVIVPTPKMNDESLEASPRAGKLRQWMNGFWQSAQRQGASDSALNQANSMVNQAATAEIESWLNYAGGRARVTLDAGLKQRTSDAGLDYLLPLYNGEDDTLFTQFSAHRWGDSNTINLGLGWRHLLSPDLMFGGNMFYDQDLTRQHRRLGVGLELDSQRIHTSVNYYTPVSGWRQSDEAPFSDSLRYDLYERAARGWDINLQAAPDDHFAVKAGLFQWYGDKVDVYGSRKQASKNPYGVNVGVTWQPIPLLSLHEEQSFVSNRQHDVKVGLDLHWEFGRTLAEMLDPARASAMPSLMQSRTDFVQRNNRVVLAYKEQPKSWQIYFDPSVMRAKAGSAPFTHAVKGTAAAVTRYHSSDASVARVDSASGRVTPLTIGEATISAATFVSASDHLPVSNASYRLTVLPGDFAPSASDVAIDGSALIGSELTGRYTYHANGGEKEGATLQRWFHADDMTQPVAQGDRYTVTAADLDKTLVFQVTPVSVSHFKGAPAEAQIAGPVQRLDALEFVPQQGGVAVGQHEVKFTPGSAGSLLFTVRARDEQGRPLADRTVWWRQDANGPGKLAVSQSRTDASGTAQVLYENITHAGRDDVIATLRATDASAPDRNEQQSLSFSVSIAQPTLALNSASNTSPVTVGSGPLRLIASLTEPSQLGIGGRRLNWSSNGQPAGHSVTSDAGISVMELAAPAEFGSGFWQVKVALEDGDASEELTLELARQNVSALQGPDSVQVSYGNPPLRLAISGGNSGNKLYRSTHPDVVAVDSHGELTFGNVGSASVIVSQPPTETENAPGDLHIAVKVTPAAGNALTVQDMQLKVNQSQPLSVSGGNGGTLSYRSADSTLVTVDDQGRVTAHRVSGDAGVQITVTEAAGEHYLAQSVTLQVRVERQQATQLTGPDKLTADYLAPSQLLVIGGGNGGTLNYASDNPAVAGVNAAGEVSFINAGQATISVSQQATEQQEAPDELKIPVEVKAIAGSPLSAPDLQLKVGDTRQITLQGGNDGALSYRSSAAAIVSVDNNGQLIASATGAAPITVTQQPSTNYLAQQTSFSVAVELNDATQLSGPEYIDAYYGDAPRTLTIGGGNGGTRTFTSDNSDVVSINAEGKMTFHNVGEATLIVNEQATSSHKAPVPLSIPVNIFRVAGTPLVAQDVQMTVGQTAQISISGGNGGSRFFSSQDTAKVRVDNAGNLTAFAAGSVIINVGEQQSSNFMGQQTTITVTVDLATPQPLQGPGDISVTVGAGPQTLAINGGNTADKVFSSSDSNVVAVDSGGVLTFASAGSATVIVTQPATSTEKAPDPLSVQITVNPAAQSPLSLEWQFVSNTTIAPVTATYRFRVTRDGQAVSGVCVGAYRSAAAGGGLLGTTTSSSGYKNFTVDVSGVESYYAVVGKIC